MKITMENENDICRFKLNNSKQISLVLKQGMKAYLQVKHRNKSIKYTNKRTVSRKKFHFLAVGGQYTAVARKYFSLHKLHVGQSQSQNCSQSSMKFTYLHTQQLSWNCRSTKNLANFKLLQLQYLKCVVQNSTSINMAREQDEKVLKLEDNWTTKKHMV